ncbi:MAG: hypothetical protein GQ477_03425 [Nanohaloarchaea archaeon]|nr:hypothetical protein [Candidatus Nanohaloarchaea archaeon]
MSLLSLGNVVYAVPAFNDVSVQTPEIWLGESETIFVNCSDDNSTISNVYADISTASALFPGNSFVQDADGLHYLVISTEAQSNFNKVGLFDVIVYCENELGDSVNTSVSFTVSNLSIEISSMESSIYIGDITEVDVFLRKDGNSITSDDISFKVFKGDSEVVLLPQPYYDFEKGWVLKFSTDTFSSGSDIFSIAANYSGSEISFGKVVNVYDPVDFSILDVDDELVTFDEIITVMVKATDRGDSINIDENQISVRIGSTSVSVSEVLSASASGAYDIIFTAPSLSFGKQTLKVYFEYGNYSLSDSESVVYVIPASGVLFSDTDNKHVVDMKFSSDDFSTDVRTDNDGKYSLSFPPETYDVQLKDDFSTLDIYDVEIDEFDDAIKYQSLSSTSVIGVSGQGIFYYAIAPELDYGYASLKIRYDPTKINDIYSMETYICNEWDTGNKRCGSEWAAIDSEVDSLRKTATVDDAALNAAYIVGNKDTLNVGATIDKEIYNIKEDIKITGLSQDSTRIIVSDVMVSASIAGTSISASAVSDTKGLFSFSIQNPRQEGNYTLAVNMSKDPFISAQKIINFEVVKKKEVAIVAPDTIRLSSGESTEVEFLIINTGESDLSDLSISLANIPLSYYQMIYPDNIDTLKESSEVSAVVYFDIPDNASKEMISSSFELTGSDFSKKQNFVLNILLPKNDSLDASSVSSTVSDSLTKVSVLDKISSIGMPTGNSIYLMASSEVLSVAIFTILTFSTALFFRKRRLVNAYNVKLRESNRLLIFNIKEHVFGIKKQKSYVNPKRDRKSLKQFKDDKDDKDDLKYSEDSNDIVDTNDTNDALTKSEGAIMSSAPSDKVAAIPKNDADVIDDSKEDIKDGTKKDTKSVLKLDLIADIYTNLNTKIKDANEMIESDVNEDNDNDDNISSNADVDESEKRVF